MSVERRELQSGGLGWENPYIPTGLIGQPRAWSSRQLAERFAESKARSISLPSARLLHRRLPACVTLYPARSTLPMGCLLARGQRLQRSTSGGQIGTRPCEHTDHVCNYLSRAHAGRDVSTVETPSQQGLRVEAHFFANGACP